MSKHLADPKVIRLTNARGDFYEGVSLNHEKGRIRLYVLSSNAEGLRGTVEAGTVIDHPIGGYSIDSVD